MRWADSWAASLDAEENAYWTGFRISIAVVLASVVAMYGRIVSFLWISMHGRDWLAGIVGCLISIMILAAIMVPISWFFRFKNLDEVKAAAMWWLSLVPTIITILLVIKIAFAGISGALLRRKQLAPLSAISRLLIIWGFVVVSFGLSMHLLIPDPRASLLWCLGATAVFVPLGSVLWMPISVDEDRHR
jgi:hypothetical protein